MLVSRQLCFRNAFFVERKIELHHCAAVYHPWGRSYEGQLWKFDSAPKHEGKKVVYINHQVMKSILRR